MDASNGSLLPEISATKAVAVVAVAATVGFSVGGLATDTSRPPQAVSAPAAEPAVDRAEARLRKKLKTPRAAASQAAGD